MRRTEFVLKFTHLDGIPFIPVPPPAANWKQPETIVICLGQSGRRVWNKLVTVGYPSSLFPIISRRSDVVSRLQWVIRPEKTILISHLADEILDATLRELETEEERGSQSTSAYVIDAYAVEGAKRRRGAERNLERLKRLGWSVTNINPKDFRASRKQDISLYEALAEDESRIVEAILRRSRT